MKHQGKTKQQLILELDELTRKHESLEKLYNAKKDEWDKESFCLINEIRWMEYILGATKTGVDIIDRNYNLLFIDNNWQKIYGNPDGKKCYEYFMGINEPCPKCAIPQALKSKKTIISEEYLKRENRYVEVHTIPFKDENGRWMVGEFNIDITERKKKEQELIAAKEKAEESSKLKTAFLQNLSHEIRTPLNAICGFSGMLNIHGLSEEKRNSYIAIIHNSSEQLLSIVSDVITISSLETKQEKLSINKVCVNDIISNMRDIFEQQSIRKNIMLLTKQPLNDEQSETYTDKTKVAQVITNLISNALKFTDKGFIEYGYRIKTEINPPEIEFFVKDSGIGIKPELHDIIFERFRQGEIHIRTKYGGTGLGLAISKGLVELLGGQIWVDSEENKGATFYFTIPYNPVSVANLINSTANSINNP